MKNSDSHEFDSPTMNDKPSGEKEKKLERTSVDPGKLGKTGMDLPGNLIYDLKEARDGYRHGEIIVQSRLYNYLVAVSILFLAWAALFTARNVDNRALVLAVLAILGGLLSILWAVLGLREGCFLQLHMNQIRALENRLPNAAPRLTSQIADLQGGKAVTLSDGRRLRLGWATRQLKSRRLLVFCPAMFGLAFAICLWISLTDP